MTETMKSYHVTAGQGIGELETRQRPIPEPGPGEVLVRMRAGALSLRELKVLENDYPLPITPGVVAGCEGVGEVVALGDGVRRVKVGARVAASVFPQWIDGPFQFEYAAQLGSSLDGVFTEYAVLPESGVVPIPEHLSYDEAAALPLIGLTAWNALTGGQGLRAGETVLTLGTGAVSLLAIQLAKLAGADVFATSSSPAKTDRLKALGANAVVDYSKNPNWSEEVRALTGQRGVDHVIDVAGVLDQSVRAVAQGGEVTLVGASQGKAANAEPLSAATIFRSGATLRPMAVGSRRQHLELNRAVESTAMRPLIDRVFTFDDLPEALQYYRTGTPFGRVIISHN
ncbi:NAD(P)-dependent alcohol dehydrogenase [Kribbella koreensis]|uniref:NAD(P)-dependent alcohol dehydrogenase n=1 Tax=Kribbella koreensis TaxID=57909 RepID=A0ABN1QNV7_9ACTN